MKVGVFLHLVAFLKFINSLNLRMRRQYNLFRSTLFVITQLWNLNFQIDWIDTNIRVILEDEIVLESALVGYGSQQKYYKRTRTEPLTSVCIEPIPRICIHSNCCSLKGYFLFVICPSSLSYIRIVVIRFDQLDIRKFFYPFDQKH